MIVKARHIDEINIHASLVSIQFDFVKTVIQWIKWGSLIRMHGLIFTLYLCTSIQKRTSFSRKSPFRDTYLLNCPAVIGFVNALLNSISSRDDDCQRLSNNCSGVRIMLNVYYVHQIQTDYKQFELQYDSLLRNNYNWFNYSSFAMLLVLIFYLPRFSSLLLLL